MSNKLVTILESISEGDVSKAGEYIRALKEEFGKYGVVVYQKNTISFKGPKTEEGTNLKFEWDLSDKTLLCVDNGETEYLDTIADVIKYVKSGTSDN